MQVIYKMKVRLFSIPTFNEWVANGKKTECKLGEYTLHIRPFSWSDNSVMYAFGVAANENPLNVYTKTIYHSYFSCGFEDVEPLREWYEKQVSQFNAYWQKYVTENFLTD